MFDHWRMKTPFNVISGTEYEVLVCELVDVVRLDGNHNILL
jgi:hypothetical protein